MNIHLRIEDETVLPYFEEAEMTEPCARKTRGPHIIYDSRGLIWTEKQGRPVLCDFGEARFGQESYTDDIQPYAYRAPEVILKIPWSYGVDVWNVGVMVSLFLQGCGGVGGSLMLMIGNRFGLSLKASTCSSPAIKTASSVMGFISRRWLLLLVRLRLNY